MIMIMIQRAKKVVSDSLGLVDFAIGLANFVLNLPNGKVKFLRNSNYRRTVKSTLLIKKFLGLVEMTFGLVYASLSLPEWQAVKTTFFAPFDYFIIITISQYIHVLLTVYVGFDKKLVKIDINKNNTGMWYKCQPDRF